MQSSCGGAAGSFFTNPGISIMNTEIVTKTARDTLAGTITFPEVVANMLAAGVEYYHVDYVGMCKAFYSATGEKLVSPIAYENLPSVSPVFDAGQLKANILDSQLRGQPYRAFTERAMAAGVQGYFVFLRGKQVTYFGRNGDQHTEWFPGAGPSGDTANT